MFKIVKVIFSAIITIVTLYTSLLVFLPRISISPSVILDPQDPFKTPFIITNDGFFKIKDISVRTALIKVIDTNNTRFEGVGLESNINDQQRLRPSKQTNLNIHPNIFIHGIKAPFKEAEIGIAVDFQSLYFFNKSEVFKFRMATTTAGEANWIPINSN